ncbi:hypothetical protein SAMN04489712_11747 [Thermomonospora echinospora]|uniref:Cupredoxin-like domain-containing protein n=1 Tax=Thermomonospora echinospora TaxID=1992 RepID=A0A1H6DJ11_9ACTN|nr:hypothetical protein [Thermomonospora echinospora]SEG84675.1 hypothetical protein SAMN04489712_11747 [Thermomonospora echinospora]
MRAHSTALPAAVLTVLAALTSGCGEPATDGPTASTAPTSPANPAGSAGPAGSVTAAGQVVPVTVTVTKGRATGTGGRVKVPRGARVRITVTSDAADEFHLHGYDRSLRLEPGRPGVVELTADVPGVFEVELHEAGTRLFELQVG